MQRDPHFSAELRTKSGSVSVQMTRQWPQPKQVPVMAQERRTGMGVPTTGASGGRWSSENRNIVLTCRSSDPTSGSSHTEVSERAEINLVQEVFTVFTVHGLKLYSLLTETFSHQVTMARALMPSLFSLPVTCLTAAVQTTTTSWKTSSCESAKAGF